MKSEAHGMRHRLNWDAYYFRWGVTAFAVVVCSILFYAAVTRFPALFGSIQSLLGILAPVLWGLIIAYMLTPIAKRLERLLRRLFPGLADGRGARIFRAISIVLAILITLSLLTLILVNLLPQIYASLETLIFRLPGYVTTVIAFAQHMLDGIPGAEEVAINLLEEGEAWLLNWVNATLLPNIDVIILAMTAGVWGFVQILINLFLGLVLSVYVMYNRERFAAQIKKLLYSLMPGKQVALTLRGAQHVDRAFGRFFLSRVLDSLFIGTTVFLFLTVMGMPYVALITVVVAITNTIPFVGPFIGGIPAALLIFMENPIQGLIFAVFILVLQQIDGNIIGPRIAANVTGLPGFWILFSILVGGGLFGFTGMLLGVPVFSLIYDGFGYLTDRRLKRLGLSTDTMAYSANAPPLAAPVEPTAEDDAKSE